MVSQCSSAPARGSKSQAASRKPRDDFANANSALSTYILYKATHILKLCICFKGGAFRAFKLFVPSPVTTLQAKDPGLHRFKPKTWSRCKYRPEAFQGCTRFNGRSGPPICVAMASSIFGSSLDVTAGFHGKLLITTICDGSSIGQRVPCDSPIMVVGSELPLGLVAVYDMVMIGQDDFIYLRSEASSWWTLLGDSGDLSPKLLELCAGAGGMGIGASFLGGIPHVAVDFNSLACVHLNANSHGTVLQLDLMDEGCPKMVHQTFGESPGTTLFGFPCQPHSSQGFQLGSQDVRFGVFWKGLQIIFLTHSRTAILECVPKAGENADVDQGIRMLAHAMNWDILVLDMDLHLQWPCRRSRWFVLLLPQAWNTYGLHQWPSTSPYRTVGDLFHCWGRWSDDDETNLQLFDFELQAYSNPVFGSDKRLLEFGDQANTFLHSYGNALTACPCGCRVGSFSNHSLRTRGLRGCFVQSLVHHNPRFLHPRELGLLLGLPDSVQYSNTPRAGLSLLGLVASPIQLVWIYAHLRVNVAKALHWDPMPSPLECLRAYQSELVHQSKVLFQHTTAPPQCLHLVDPDGHDLWIACPSACTVGQLLKAQCILLDWNEAGGISLDGRQLSLHSFLDLASGPYALTRHAGSSLRPPPTAQFVVGIKHLGVFSTVHLRAGRFLFEALRDLDILDVNFLVDHEGRIYGADFRVWKSLNLVTLLPDQWPLRRIHAAGNMSPSFGLHDGHLTWVLEAMLKSLPTALKPMVISPQDALDLLQQTSTPSLGRLFSASDDRIICIFSCGAHWAVLFGHLQVQHLQWTYCDGLLDQAASTATRLASLISTELSLDWSISPCHLIRQEDMHTCGTIALFHVGALLGLHGLPSRQAILDFHAWLLHRPALGLPGLGPWIYGSGPLGSDPQAALAALLATKGVPSDMAVPRAAAALKKLTASAVQQALNQSNPWQALKALTSKPGNSFQFVLKHELKDYIESRAQTRHGASISTDKKKKDKRPAKDTAPPAALLDPETLQLDPSHFVDDEGDQVAQIKLSQVTADARGLAIASLAASMPYLQERKNISADALGLLILEEVPSHLKATANVTALRFPVTYLPTQDPLLIHGSLLQLGDHAIVRRALADPVTGMDVAETQVLKVQLFKDELTNWEAVAASPIRQLFTLVPLFKLCTSVSCDHRCGLFHAAVEDNLDQVVHEIWGRRFQSMEGKILPAPQADIFLAYLRIAAPALSDLLKVVVEGVYLEPRANGLRATDSDYAVIWLPGASRDAAVHRLKLTTHGLSLVRMKMRMGIRVLSVYEEASFKELRPGDTYVKVDISKIFRIHPLPHGLQRQQVVQLLREWRWQAKPLQPARGSAEGGSWEIGAASDPPSNVMTAFGRDVLVSLVKDKQRDANPPPALVGSVRAHRHLRAQAPAVSTSPQSSADPWHQPGQDPWQHWHGPKLAASNDSAKRYDILAEKLKSDLQTSLGQHLEAQMQGAPASTSSSDTSRIQKLETDMEEIKAHHSTFHSWFKETGNKLAIQDEQLAQLHASVQQNQQDLQVVRSEVHTSAEGLHQAMQLSFGTMKQDLSSELTSTMTSQMDRIESMLCKKQRNASVWSFSETHLTYQTQRTCAQVFRSLASQQQRQLRIHLGAPVATRASSDWAGTWSGVATVSDFPSQEVALPYNGERECGRVLTIKHSIGHCCVTNTVVYGYPRGPTWPNATALTTDLLQIVTTEVILGGFGPRLVGGDFNVDSAGLPLFDYWRQLGWISAQELAERLWHQEPSFTCKHATERDLVWLSPEAAALCRFVDVADVYCDHSTVTVGLELPMRIAPTLQWVKPSPIPWTSVDPQWTSTAVPPVWTLDGTVDAQWSEWASSFEHSLQGFLPDQPGFGLSRQQKGRLQQTQPTKRLAQTPVLRPSRPSEVVLRNDLIGSEIKLWFRQLRRLQSYCAAINAGKMTSSAISYRLELWSSIKRSPGFVSGFSYWWQHLRVKSLPDTPSILPSAPPSSDLADRLFRTFKLNFEDFEAWHLRQRSRLLLAKYDKGMAGLFQDLRAPHRDKLDFLSSTQTCTVLAMDSETGEVHLDSNVSCDGHSTWTFEGQRISVRQINEVVIQLQPVVPLEHGDVLVHTQTISSTTELHQQLLDFWRPTWCALESVPAETWQRVTAFFQHYVPSLPCALGDITVDQWRRALRRYKPSAARGVDGVSHLDLLALPPAWTQRLLDLLHLIESGSTGWPTAVLYGIVNVLAKEVGACSVSRFRPIVIFSIIYRTWARLRARQLLRWLTPWMGVEAYGFMPGCEPSQLWLLLQGEIETALQNGSSLCGLSTDLQRAFNFIPRQHTFELASHLGVPTRILGPWRSFLDHCTRAFDVRGTLSPCTRSTCGMPEGDAMSVYGMVQLCFAWHLYMRAYAPQIRSLSFVDNLCLVSLLPELLASGLTCLLEFFKLWNLTVDAAKSYCWALTEPHRKELAALPFARVDHAHELGGVLSFTRRRFTGLQQKRISRLPPLWKRLQTSRAPLRLKLAAIPTVFWASALHGINGSCMGENHLDTLRSQAMRSLRLAHAGVNGLLCLTLSSTPVADPGFWRLRMTVKAFVRLLRKEPRLFSEWKKFMLHFDGTLFSGPFSQLLIVLNQVGWRIEPPFLFDHDELGYDLRSLDVGILDSLLHDAWLQHVARQVVGRNTMNDLVGLDPLLLNLDSTTLTSLQQSLMSSLRSGAFMNRAMQARFDYTKNALCSSCGVPDDNLHWLVCPRFENVRTALGNWQHNHSSDSRALKAHLLPSRSQYAAMWKRALLDIPDTSCRFLSTPSLGTQHLFTDGSASCAKQFFQIAAWGCINAETGLLVTMGFVPGLCQSNDRAELQAVVSALEWQIHFGASVHLWIDSKFVADGLSYVLQHGVADDNWSHLDLWDRVQDLLQQRGQLELVPQWIPSHLDPALLTCPFEEWISHWNNKIDVAVGHLNWNRPSAFLQLRSAAQQHFLRGAERLRMLREFYFAVASKTAAEIESPEIPEVSLFGFVSAPQSSVGDLYIDDLHHLVASSTDRPCDLPVRFVVALINHLFVSCDPDSGVYPLCFEELTLWLAKDFQFECPCIFHEIYLEDLALKPQSLPASLLAWPVELL
eukprot:s1553_g8.t1